MDKLNKLKDSVIKRDKRSFIGSIYDFSEEDIIRLTEQEFKEIQECCTKIKLNELKDLLYFLLDEGILVLSNSEIERDKENALVGRFYLSIFLKLYLENDKYTAIAKINLGFALGKLVDLGIEQKKNLEESIKLCTEAKTIFPKGSSNYANATTNQGIDYLTLAKLGIDSKKNLEQSKKLLHDAINLLPKHSSDLALATMNLGIVHLILGELGIEPEKNFEVSIKFQQNARKIFPKKSINYARSSGNQGVALAGLSRLGIEPEKNLKEAIKLQQQAIEILPNENLDCARAMGNLASDHFSLARIGIESETNFKIAEKLYCLSRNIALNAKGGWDYPVAILNCYFLYRSLFWKKGDKKFLEKANDSLKEAKKNIETWDVLGKKILLGTLYSVEADLYELSENYFDAGMKYRDAYKLTGNEYYRFMCEFCKAKTSGEKKIFCQLMKKWERHNKKTIFLDFYDYSVFECHLEEALENEALRFDEINAAKSKLDEIYSRTQIYHVKTRVGAYIDIINAYLNYFPEKDEEIDEEKAKQNIFSACKIFKSQGYLHEVEVCNLFSKAIKNKDSQEVWLGLIKNNLSNNLSKLIGEAAIDELTKSQTQRIKADLGEIKAGVKEIKKNLDELKSELITRFEKIEKDIGDIAQDDEVLRNLLIGYANKTHGILNNLLDESKKSDSRTQEFAREFSEEITKKLEEKDDRWLEKLKVELIINEKEIEDKMPSAPPEIKNKWHLWIDKLKKELTETVRDIPHEAVVYVSTEKILEYGIPFLSAAIGSPYGLPALIAILTTMHMVLPEPKDE